MHFHLHHFHRLQRYPVAEVGVKPLYWNLFLLRLAQSFTAIFVPVYLFQLGIGIFGQGAIKQALALVFGVFALERVVALATVFPAALATRKFGFRWVMLFSNVLRAGTFIFLLLAKENVWLLLPTIVFGGLMLVLYWPSFHTVFASDGSVGGEGHEVGGQIGWEHVAGVVGPVVGGVIVAGLGFEGLFLLGVILVIFSSGPIFFMRHHQHSDGVSVKELWRWLGERRFQKAGLSFVGYYLERAGALYLWPLYVFLILLNYERLGVVFSIGALGAVVTSWFVGKLFDGGRRRKLFAVGSIATAAVWLVKATLSTFGRLVVVDLVEKILSVFYVLPFLGYQYRRARGAQVFSFMIYREVLMSFGAIWFWLLSIILLWVPGFWYAIFALSGLGAVLSQFILESDKE